MRPIRCLRIAAALLAAAPALFAADRPPVATVGGAAVTAEDLDRALGNRLMRVRSEEYQMKRAALDELISERLFKREAEKRHVTVDELLKAEVDAKVSVPTPAEVEPFYEGTREHFGNMPHDEAIQQIIDGMRRQRTTQRKNDFAKALRDAAGVKVLLEPPRADVKADGPARGNGSAPVTIVEFSDFECPFCGRASATVSKLRDKYGDKVRIVFRDYPLPSHRSAPRAAEAAHCADDQGKFWEMHDKLFSKTGPVAESDIRKYAEDIGLDLPRFAQCLDSGKHTETWKAAQLDGVMAGVGSTPTFFVNGRMLIGAAPIEAFASVIDEELERAAASGGSR